MGLLHTFMSCIFKYKSKYCHSNDIYKEYQPNLNGTIRTLRQFLASLHYRLRTALLKKTRIFFLALLNLLAHLCLLWCWRNVHISYTFFPRATDMRAVAAKNEQFWPIFDMHMNFGFHGYCM